MKKEWEKPSLQVIVRNKPEEAVLGACKLFTPIGPDSKNTRCFVIPVLACVACSGVSGT